MDGALFPDSLQFLALDRFHTCQFLTGQLDEPECLKPLDQDTQHAADDPRFLALEPCWRWIDASQGNHE